MVCETISTAARASARANKLSSNPPNILLGGVGRHARRIASELPPPLLLIVLLCLDEEQEDEGALEVRVEEEDEECKLEYLGSAKLV